MVWKMEKATEAQNFVENLLFVLNLAFAFISTLYVLNATVCRMFNFLGLANPHEDSRGYYYLLTCSVIT